MCLTQVSDGVHVFVAVGVFHHRGVRGEGRACPFLHGDCRCHLVRNRVLLKVSTLLFIYMYKQDTHNLNKANILFIIITNCFISKLRMQPLVFDLYYGKRFFNSCC